MTTRHADLGSTLGGTPGRDVAVCTVARGSYASSATRPVYTNGAARQAAGGRTAGLRRAPRARTSRPSQTRGRPWLKSAPVFAAPAPVLLEWAWASAAPAPSS